jgi:hypothetical protein
MKNYKYSFRYNNILEITQIKSTWYGKKSFRFAAPTLWNSLPNHFRTENSFSHKAAFRKKQQVKRNNTEYLKLVPT